MVKRRSTPHRRPRPRARQGEFPFPPGRGGRRHCRGRRPGRPSNGPLSGVSHLRRAPLASRYPVHVTLRLAPGLPSLRRARAYRTLLHTFAAGSDRLGFRLVQYSVLRNHMHLIVEARDRRALSRGMQGLSIRIAKGLNRLWHRCGRVFSDRYHDRILRTPREVRHALAYVLQNARKHGIRCDGPDRFSSAPWFDGWREKFECLLPTDWPQPVAGAGTWLLRVGWRRHALIRLAEVPGG